MDKDIVLELAQEAINENNEKQSERLGELRKQLENILPPAASGIAGAIATQMVLASKLRIIAAVAASKGRGDFQLACGAVDEIYHKLAHLQDLSAYMTLFEITHDMSKSRQAVELMVKFSGDSAASFASAIAGVLTASKEVKYGN